MQSRPTIYYPHSYHQSLAGTFLQARLCTTTAESRFHLSPASTETFIHVCYADSHVTLSVSGTDRTLPRR
jgi:hypothetical protein